MKFKLKNFIKLSKKRMKLKEILDSQEALGVIANLKGLELATSFKLGVLIKDITHFIDVFNTKRDALIMELGTPVKDENGNEIGKFEIREEEKVKKFKKDIEELREVEVETELPEIKSSDFSKVAEAPSPLTFAALNWLIKE